MALKEYLDNYKRKPLKRGYFYGTELRASQWEEVLTALENGFQDTTALVDWLVDECEWDGVVPKSIRNRINEEKQRIRKSKSVS